MKASTRWIMIALAAACAVATTLANRPAHAQAALPLPYDESADPHRTLREALVAARHEHKRVLVVFGANWSPDCQLLDQEFHAGGKTETLVAGRYEVVKVDVGRFDKNLDFVKLYGDPIAKGIPSVVVVTPTNDVVYETKAGELANARSMGPQGMYDFFAERADARLNP